MKEERIIMGMPVRITIAEEKIKKEDIQNVFSYLNNIDCIFSTYNKESEMEKINRGEINDKNYSKEMKKILILSEQTRIQTEGYFNIYYRGRIDPSGIVKGYAILQSAEILRKKGYKNFSVEIAGDVQVNGHNHEGKKWKIGIQNPFNQSEIVKIVYLKNKGIATSGTYKRGKHIYDPIHKRKADYIASITVIASNIYEADRFATSAFAMGEKGIQFIENLKNCEGYMVTKDKKAYFTSGFESYLN